MTPEEVAALLRQIAARDNRRTGPETIAAWLEDLDGLTFDDCREAVRRHYRESADWITAAHVRRLVRDIRADRLKNSDLAIPAADPDNQRSYSDALRHIVRTVGDGRTPFRAIGPAAKTGPSQEFQEVRADLAEVRRNRLLTFARDLDTEISRPTCDCGALLDRDGFCFACPTPTSTS